MADYYKIEAHIRNKKCADSEINTSEKEDSGIFKVIIPVEQECNIDGCEQALIPLVWDAQMDAFARHLSLVSRQYALKTACSPDQCSMKDYQVDSEMGRIVFPSLVAEADCTGNRGVGRPSSHSSSACPVMVSNRRIQGDCYGLWNTTRLSYRNTEELLARVRHQKDSLIPFRTLQDKTGM